MIVTLNPQDVRNLAHKGHLGILKSSRYSNIIFTILYN